MQLKLFLAILLIFGILGCATGKKETMNLQLQQLNAQIDVLKADLRKKDEEIYNLGKQLAEARKQKNLLSKETKIKEAKKGELAMNPKNIQVALKNAGFYNGPIDGKIGKGTKKAIVDFQKANGLVADGVIGKQTWLKLNKYLK